MSIGLLRQLWIVTVQKHINAMIAGQATCSLGCDDRRNQPLKLLVAPFGDE
ncbi:hypothetical protein [Streptacidiphilus sp. EB129]|uniref:hypothetical protein n=1 Tax=Streptacidiphilus sp. EB129 TaxID=3156262 RepID=UPI0035146F34